MEISVLMTMFLISILEIGHVTAKSNPVIVTHEGKMRYSHKQNSVSTTTKPDVVYQNVQQFQSVQPEKQQSLFAQTSQTIPQQLQQLVLQPVHYQRPSVNQVAIPVQSQLYPQTQQQIIQLIQKVLYNAQQTNQPTAMIIIAQPAYVTPSVGGSYSSNAQQQQLLNYFHSNPQARYQFVHGTQPTQPITQPITQYVQQPHAQIIQASQSVASYPVHPAPVQYQTKILPVSQTTHMSPVLPSETYSHQQSPVQLSHISHLAQLASQQYYQQSQVQPQYQEPESRQNDVEYPSSLPPIITGLENFAPEQQEKIKAQLSAHFGAPLQPLQVGQKQMKEAAGTGNYQSLNTDEFVPSQELKRERSSRSNIMSINKGTYTKM